MANSVISLSDEMTTKFCHLLYAILLHPSLLYFLLLAFLPLLCIQENHLLTAFCFFSILFLSQCPYTSNSFALFKCLIATHFSPSMYINSFKQMSKQKQATIYAKITLSSSQSMNCVLILQVPWDWNHVFLITCTVLRLISA